MSDYYDIDKILADEIKVDVVFISNSTKGSIPIAATGLGGLDVAAKISSSNDLPSGTVVSVPLWSAMHLARSGLVSIVTPELYSPEVCYELSACSEGLRLGQKNPNYFENGMRIAGIQQNQELMKSLVFGFHGRMAATVSQSFNSHRRSASETYMRLLTDVESSLYSKAYESNDALECMNSGELHRVKPSRFVESIVGRAILATPLERSALMG